MKMRYNDRLHWTGFTLIELIVVVAIISILAGIALPNLLDAQVRARVSRVKNDQRTIATALEAYFIDHDRYPPESALDANASRPKGYRYLTTPIAYISGRPQTFTDIFMGSQVEMDFRERRFDAFYEMGVADAVSAGPGPNRRRDRYILDSVGPDGRDSVWPTQSYPQRPETFISYDPTNGIFSIGDIWRAGGVSLPPWLNRSMSP